MNVLVVDDSALMRKIIARSLKVLGASGIWEAANGEEALGIFCDGSRFDLMVTDWDMPVMNGLELTQRIRATGNHLPIVMVTTESEKESVLRALQAGVNDYLVKPFDNRVLKSKLLQLLSVPV